MFRKTKYLKELQNHLEEHYARTLLHKKDK